MSKDHSMTDTNQESDHVITTRLNMEGERPEPDATMGRTGGLVRSDLELPLWAIAGFVIGVVLEVASASVYIIAIVVLVSIGRLYMEKTKANSRPGLTMVPLFLFGWGLGLLVRAMAAL